SLRTILARDIDYSDRFELITLPGSDSIRLAALPPASGARPPAGTGTGKAGGGAASAGGLNYPLYQALGADFAVAVTSTAADTTVVTVHDVAGSTVRRELRSRLPPLTDPGFRMAVHRLSDRVLEATLGAPGIAATRVLFVMDGKVNVKYGCCLQRLTVGRFYDNLSPTYSPAGQRIAFVSTRAGLPQIYVMAADGTDQQLFAPFDYGATGSSNAPEWSPDGQAVAF